jgi:ABC-type nitrate/sulfonate/bicarbonate transport system ATPase subunit/ABC-type nitrate/sulfonate/bicarbonate transport system permease component
MPLKPNKRKNKPFNFFIFPLYVFSLCVLYCAWKVLAAVIHSPLILPQPDVVLLSLIQICKTAHFWEAVFATLQRVCAAFFITLLCGSVLGFLGGASPYFAVCMRFPLSVIRSTPVVSFILLALFWFDSTTVPVFVAFLMALPVMITAVMSGYACVDNNLLIMAKIYRLATVQRLRYIIIQSIIPFFNDGVLSTFGMCWKVVVAGEVLSIPRKGIGTQLQIAQIHLETQDVFAITLMVVVFSFVIELFLSALIRFMNMRKPLLLHTDEQRMSHSRQGYEKHLSAIVIENIGVVRNNKIIFDDFSLSITGHSRVCLIAPSGTGKTTLLDYIAGCLSLEKNDSFSNFSSDAEQQRIAYLFQEPRLLEQCTILDNVAIPLIHQMNYNYARRVAVQLLSDVGLKDRLLSYPDQLSGGEKQRVALARAFAFPADILLMDEAFQSQDINIKIVLMDLLERLLRDNPRTVLMVTHDIREAVCLCDRVIVLSGAPARIVFDEKNDTFFSGSGDIYDRYINATPEQLLFEKRITASLVSCKNTLFTVP